jgi:non-ribosomal peptide synthetase component F
MSLAIENRPLTAEARVSQVELIRAIFEDIAVANPGRPAVEFRGETISYATLDRASNRLARHLRTHGVCRGDYVGLLLTRSPAVYVALLAILKAGAAYVPLDPDGPGERVRYIIYTSGSTGWPKGVQVEHRNVCHFLRTERRLFSVKPEDRVYQGFSIAFDASVEEIWLAFAAGGCLVVVIGPLHATIYLISWYRMLGSTITAPEPRLP